MAVGREAGGEFRAPGTGSGRPATGSAGQRLKAAALVAVGWGGRELALATVRDILRASLGGGRSRLFAPFGWGEFVRGI